MKIIPLLCFAFLIIASLSLNAQTSLNNNDIDLTQLESNLNPNDISIGDIILIQKPAVDEYLFIHPKSDDTKKIRKHSKLVGAIGRGLSTVGVGAGSMEVLQTGTRISTSAGVLDSALEVSEFFKKNMIDLEVVLTDVNVERINGMETLLGEFKIKRKLYIVQLTNALYSDEISLK